LGKILVKPSVLLQQYSEYLGTTRAGGPSHGRCVGISCPSLAADRSPASPSCFGTGWRVLRAGTGNGGEGDLQFNETSSEPW